MATAIHPIQSGTIFELGAGNWKTISNTALENYLLFEEIKTFKNQALAVFVMKLQNRDLHRSSLKKICEDSHF